MSNQEAVDIARKTRDPQKAAEQLTVAALNKDSKDDISCVVVRFRNSALTWNHSIPFHSKEERLYKAQ